jgi:hypothetical protein
MSIQENNYSLGRAARTTTTLGMAGLVLLGGAAIGAPAMAADAAPAGDVSAAVAGSHHHGKHQVTLQAPSSATKGSSVTLNGKVKHNHHHKTHVVIQKKHGKKWQKLDATKTSKKGTFHTTDVLKGKKQVTIRAKAKGHGTSAAETVTLTKAAPAPKPKPNPKPNPNPKPDPKPDPMQVQVPAGNTQELLKDIDQAPNGATLHLSGIYNVSNTGHEVINGKDWYSGIVVNKALTLDGGKLQSDGSSNVVDVGPQGDLTLTGGIWVTGGHADEDGGGIYNAGIVVADNAYIWGNTAVWGGGVYNAGENATFTLNGGEVGSHNSGDGNEARASGAGILNDGGQVTLNGGSIAHNTAESGGGIESHGGIVDLYGGEITGNEADFGGGIDLHKGKLKVQGQEITKEGAASAFVHGNTAYGAHRTDNIRFL